MTSTFQDNASVAPGIVIGAAAAFLVLVAALAALFAFSPQQVDEFVAGAPARVPRVPIAGLILVSPLLALAAYLFGRGTKVCAARQFVSGKPAEATRLTGPAAIRRGRILKLLAVGLFTTGIAIPLVLWRLVSLSGSAA